MIGAAYAEGMANLTADQKTEVATLLHGGAQADYDRLRDQGMEHEMALDRALAPVRNRTRGTLNVLR
jgi:hypothetical protein